MQLLTSHLVKNDHTVTWCLVQMRLVMFISSNELHFAKAYYQSFYLHVPLNSKVFEPRKTCSTNLLMSILGCGYFVHKYLDFKIRLASIHYILVRFMENPL